MDGSDPLRSRERNDGQVRATVAKLEAWLLSDQVQVAGGDHDGAVVGWLDQSGAGTFLYPEITGYYLTWLSFLQLARPESEAEATRRSGRAVAWLARMSAKPLLPTRIYREAEPDVDWRSGAVFCFDVAMVLRGVAQAIPAVGHPAQEVLSALGARFDEWFAIGEDLLRSHRLESPDAILPRRWSTEPGPHHVKAAAAVLLLPDQAIGPNARTVAQRTLEHWVKWGTERLPAQTLVHPELYFIEGLLLAAVNSGRESLFHCASEQLHSVLEGLRPDGSLPPSLDEPDAPARSDVIAQTLRAGCVLTARHPSERQAAFKELRKLAAALEQFLTPQGSIVFARVPTHQHRNTWSAMFAHQAFSYLRLAATDGGVPGSWVNALV
jgi:hypothetical protein